MMKKILVIISVVISLSAIKAQNGIRKTYYSKTQVESKVSFVNDVLEGTAQWFYENGNLRSEKTYTNGKLNGWVREFYENGLLKKEQYVRNGILDGISKEYFDNGELKEVSIYNNGILENISKFKYDSNFVPTYDAYVGRSKRSKKSQEDFICNLDKCPEPLDGIKGIEKKLVYPKLAKEKGIEGFVLITAKINKKGIVENVDVIKKLGLGFDEAAIKAVKNTIFIPGQQNGENVDAEVTFKLSFKLKKKRQKKIVVKNIKKKKHSEKVKKFIICKGNVCPKLKESTDEFLKRIKYPPQAKRNKIKGDVIIEAKINDFGFVISTKVIKKLGYGCDTEAQLQVLRTQFIPAKINGKEVTSTVKIRVPFGKM